LSIDASINDQGQESLNADNNSKYLNGCKNIFVSDPLARARTKNRARLGYLSFIVQPFLIFDSNPSIPSNITE
jgi:hypothetical protein